MEESEGNGETGEKVDELIRLTIRRRREGSSSAHGLVDITTLIDFFS